VLVLVLEVVITICLAHIPRNASSCLCAYSSNLSTSFLPPSPTLRTTLRFCTQMETLSLGATKAAQLLNVRVRQDVLDDRTSVLKPQDVAALSASHKSTVFFSHT
jgi:hypothetical protein